MNDQESASSSGDQAHLGGCACGGVAYEVRGPLRNVWDCHCEPCRRFTGHHMAASGAAVVDVAFVSDATLRWWARVPGVEYGFCATCGSSLFWRAADKPGHLSICAGTLDQPTSLVTEGVLFASEAGGYHRLDPDVEAFALDRETPSG